jgi:citrate synthase
MSLIQIIADTLGIPDDRVSDSLSFNSIPEWDSLNHINLMLALEESYGLDIDEDAMIELTSVRAIKDFINA